MPHDEAKAELAGLLLRAASDLAALVISEAPEQAAALADKLELGRATVRVSVEVLPRSRIMIVEVDRTTRETGVLALFGEDLPDSAVAH